jgi:hypothetical protein
MTDLAMSDDASLYSKIAKVMGEVGRVEKRGFNDFHKYAYATEADLVEAVREKLSAAYKAMTGALKYFLMKTFLIPTGDDPEADTGSDARSAGRRPGRTADGVTASEKQVKYVEKLVKEKRVTVPQLNFMLREIGSGLTVEEGWSKKLTAGREGSASQLIEWLTKRPLPDTEHPSDVPSDGDFSHGDPGPETDLPYGEQAA